MGNILRKLKMLIAQNGRFIACSTLVLWLSFSFNIFGAMTQDAFMNNFKDSESLTVNSIVCVGQYFDGQLVFRQSVGASGKYVCDPAELTPYSSQFGLQGRLYTSVYGALNSALGMSSVSYVIFAQLVTALLSALCFAIFAVWVRRRYGLIPALVVVAGIALSPMIVGFARNLYWALPLMVAPFLYTFIFYRSLGDKEIHPAVFWAGLFVLFYLRLLCGYEYVTSFTLSVFAGMVPYLYESRSRLREYFNQAIIVLGVAVLAFSTAIVTHVVSLSHSTGSVYSAIEVVKSRALERTLRGSEYTKYAIEGLKSNLPVVYSVADNYVHFDGKQQSLKWAVVAAGLNYLFMPIALIPLQFAEPFGTILQSFLASMIILSVIFVYRKKLFDKKSLKRVEGLYAGLLTSIVAYVSWLIMASSHSLVHAHINGILMYLPYGLFAFTIVGLVLQRIFSKIREPYAKKKR